MENWLLPNRVTLTFVMNKFGKSEGIGSGPGGGGGSGGGVTPDRKLPATLPLPVNAFTLAALRKPGLAAAGKAFVSRIIYPFPLHFFSSLNRTSRAVFCPLPTITPVQVFELFAGTITMISAPTRFRPPPPFNEFFETINIKLRIITEVTVF